MIVVVAIVVVFVVRAIRIVVVMVADLGRRRYGVLCYMVKDMRILY